MVQTARPYKLPEFTSLKKCASFCNGTCTVPCKRVAEDPCKRGLLRGKWPDYSLQVQTNAVPPERKPRAFKVAEHSFAGSQQ